MSNLYSKFYIGTGEETKMYTLRHQYEEIISLHDGNGNYSQAVVMRDYYMRNLSIDADKAKEKAEEMGYAVSKPKFSLEEIARNENVQSAHEQAIAEDGFRTTQKQALDYEIQLVQEGLFPFGYSKAFPLIKIHSEKGDSWAKYWMKYGRQDDATATIKLLGAKLELLFPELAELEFMDKKGNGIYFGQVGVRQKKVVVRCVESFGFDGFYGYTYIKKFLTESGELLTYKGSASQDIELGEEVVISFGIKEHGVYDGVNQTNILRIKVDKV